MVDLGDTPIVDVMTTDVQLLHGETTLREAFATLEDYGISGAPVVDEAGQVIGVFSLADLGRRETEVEEGESPRATSYFKLNITERLPVLADAYDSEHYGRDTVGDWMSTDIKAMPPAATVRDAAEMMTREGIHRVLVMEGKTLRGVVTALDLVSLIAETPARLPVREAPRPARHKKTHRAPAKKPRKRSA